MSLHLQPVSLAELKGAPLYLVMVQHGLALWNPNAASILSIHHNQISAEHHATEEKKRNTHNRVGVFKLVCEAQSIPQPVQIVRMEKD